MSSRLMSLRVSPRLVEQLDQFAAEMGSNRSQVAQMLLEEGLRMAEHSGITFRSGPGGRRPGLAAGADVWEIVRVFRDLEERGDDAIKWTARLTGAFEQQVRTAVRYYAEYPQEIDEWIARADAYAERQEGAWRRDQAMLHA